MSGWEQYTDDQKDINFDQLFASQTFNAVKLITMDKIVQQSKRQKDKIAEMLIKNPKVMEDLLDICIRPQQITDPELGKITTQHTFKALEVIFNLEIQRFSEYLLGINQAQPEEDCVISQQIHYPQIPLITKVMNNLQYPTLLQQTPLSNMCKIASNLCSQKPKQFLTLLQQRSIILQGFCRHFYSSSVLQLMIRILEVEDSTTFYQQDKVRIFENFANKLDKIEHEKQIRTQIIQNYRNLLTCIYEKTDDRFQKEKFIGLCKVLFPHPFIVEKLLINTKQLLNSQKLQQQIEYFKILLEIMEKYLRFNHNYKPNLQNNSNINKSISHLNLSSNRSQNNLGNDVRNSSNANGLDSSTLIDVVLDHDMVQQIRNIVQRVALFCVSKPPQKIQFNFVLAFFQLLRALLLILQPSQNSFVQAVISPELIRYSLQFIILKKNSTTLHNVIKDIIIQGIIKTYQHTVTILLDRQKSSFIYLVSEIRQKGNSKQNQFENQIYHIFQIVIKKGQDPKLIKFLEENIKNQEGFQQILSRIKQKQKMYSQLIGGDPRKQASCWGDSSQDDRIFASDRNQPHDERNQKKITQEVLSPTANDAIEGNIEHWFDCGGLPLDSDQSKDEQSPKKQQIVQPSSPVCVKILSDLDSKQQKQQAKEQSQISKRLKNIGIKQCLQQQIRIPIRKQKKAASGRKKNIKGTQDDRINENKKEDTKPVIDSVQMELQDQIMKLQKKRLNDVDGMVDQEYQVEERLKKKVDSLQQEDIPSISNCGHQNQPMIISELMDLSSDKEKQKNPLQISENSFSNGISHGKIQQKLEISNNSSKQKEIQNIQKKGVSPTKQRSKSELNSPQKHRKQGENNYFPKYLSYQIDQILAELD